MLRVGQTQFFSHRIWPDKVQDPNYFAAKPDAEFPAELDATWIGHLTPGDRSGENVYARVELIGPRAADPRNPLATRRPPLAWAHELVSFVVEAATYSSGGSRWTLLNGGLVYHGTGGDGQALWDGMGGFRDPADDEAIEKYRPARLEGTGDKLETLDPRLADKLAAGDQRTVDAVREARWHSTVRGQAEPSQRVALHVRAFERALPPAEGGHWGDAVAEHYREFWAWDRLDTVLYSAAFWSKFWLEAVDRDAAKPIITWIGDVAAAEEGVHLDRFVRASAAVYKALGRLHGDSRVVRRNVKQISKWEEKPATARAHFEVLGGRFDTLLKRALRQRNAIIHGVGTDPDVVASVDRFIARLAAYTTLGNLRSAAIGGDFADALQRSRDQCQRMLDRLENGTPLSRAWDDADPAPDAESAQPSDGEAGSREEI